MEQGTTRRWDNDIRHRARAHDHGALRATARAVHLLGFPVAYLPLAALGSRALARRGSRDAARLLLAALGGWSIHRLLKLGLDSRRPPGALRRGKRSRSFPSGHTTATTAMALVAAADVARNGMARRDTTLSLALGGALLMGATRVLLDEHWASDVVGGWLAGGAVAAACLAGRTPARARHGAAARGGAAAGSTGPSREAAGRAGLRRAAVQGPRLLRDWEDDGAVLRLVE